MFSCVTRRHDVLAGNTYLILIKTADIAVFSGLQRGLSTLLLSTMLLVYGNRVDINQTLFDILCIVSYSLFNFKVLCDFPCVTIYVNLPLAKCSLQCALLSTVMTLSAAEKQRRYRARRDANPERSLHYLEKERYWHGKVKSINANPAGTISE